MNLKEWCQAHNRHATYPTTERQAVSVMACTDPNAGWELHHLEDYIVSSVQAGVCWLVPRVKGWKVSDTPFNREWYKEMIGTVYSIPPTYVQLEEIK